MKYLLISQVLLSIPFTFLYSQELPEVIGHFSGEEISWAGSFAAIEINGDEYDDLIVSHGIGYGDQLYFNGEIYFGGERMNQAEPDLEIRPRFDRHIPCGSVEYIGNMLPDHGPVIVISHSISNQSDPEICMLDYRSLSEDINEDPLYFQSRNFGDNSFNLRNSLHNEPTDVNGDGYDDLVYQTQIDSNNSGYLCITYGGVDFDTIPDWSVYLDSTGHTSPSSYSTGFDINGDGYDDVLFRPYMQRSHYYWYFLYLGGSPMDTIPACVFHDEEFEGPHGYTMELDLGFSMLPDVNGDGYADWGAAYKEYTGNFIYDGFAIFFGGEEPDSEPDLLLNGHRCYRPSYMNITGGDFNGDGIGDIVTGMSSGIPQTGEIHMHFGSRWIDDNEDVFINLNSDYNGNYYSLVQNLGGVGDYNGDGIDDFCSEGSERLTIFAGNSDWIADAHEEEPPGDFSFSMNAYPNPFNSQVEISYSLLTDNNITIDIYDIQGRHLVNLVNGLQERGDHTLTWSIKEAGLYFVRLESGDEVSYRKTVCLP